MKEYSIIYDYRIFDGQTLGGISRYYINLAFALMNIEECHVEIASPLYRNLYLRERRNTAAGRKTIKGAFDKVFFKNERFRSVLNRVISDSYVKWKRPDIYHKTYYDGKWPSYSHMKKVITIHDLIYERYRKEFEGAESLIRKVAKDIQLADIVICVSESTKNDLLHFYPVDEKKIAVIHHGVMLCDNILSKKLNRKVQRCLEQPYILYVGKRGGYKNFKTLLRAWSSSSQLYGSFRLICFGGGTFTPKEKQELDDMGVDRCRIFHISGDDATLVEAYRYAECLVYPSLYEGFGLPTLEAMACGCPVVCANNSAIPEVVGDAGVYFMASWAESLKEQLARLVGDEEKRVELARHGYERIKSFTWEKCAMNTLTAYKTIGC